MAGKIVLVFAILVATSTSWIEAAPPYDFDFYTNDEDPTFCGRNEYYTRSAAANQPTCQDPEISFGLRIGIPGCVCKLGYVRDSEWVCIRKEEL